MEIDDDISSNTISLAHLSDYNPIPQFQTSIHQKNNHNNSRDPYYDGYSQKAQTPAEVFEVMHADEYITDNDDTNFKISSGKKRGFHGDNFTE